ncbi:hypothetical protein [Niastella sp. OAS944]|uniref:hypothetical protein n=1 Tax=Niastella sp. OAS944 TaxID=2664089 RepID=UPI003490B78F|nr:hypothetical protein [Chitinophagaceae bacterium OAS944]
MKKYALTALAIGSIIYGCKKDDDDKDVTKERIQFVTSSSWKYDTVGIDTNKDGKPDQPLTGFTVEACDKDNTILFKSDSTGTLDEGPSKCNSSDPQKTPFTWYFKENGTILYTPNQIFGTDVSGDFKVGEITTSRLRVIKDVTYPIFGTFTIVLDLKH